MSTRETGSRDPDDWFAGSEAAPISLDPGEPAPVVSDAGDDWLGEDAVGPRDGLGASLPTRWVAIGAVVLLAGCLLVAGLVLGGVFDSAKHPAAAPPTTAPTTTAAPPTTTAAPAAAATPPPTATLKPGDTGTQVEMLQRALLHLGYAAGKVDGNYGSATIAALKQFQTASKLTADGVLGPTTLAALVSALRAP